MGYSVRVYAMLNLLGQISGLKLNPVSDPVPILLFVS